MHAVEAAQISRLAATGRTDQRGHFLVVNRHVDVTQSLLFTVIKIQVTGFRLEGGLVVNLHFRVHFSIHFSVFFGVDRRAGASLT